jgi:hypothetical protein
MDHRVAATDEKRDSYGAQAGTTNIESAMTTTLIFSGGQFHQWPSVSDATHTRRSQQTMLH